MAKNRPRTEVISKVDGLSLIEIDYITQSFTSVISRDPIVGGNSDSINEVVDERIAPVCDGWSSSRRESSVMGMISVVDPRPGSLGDAHVSVVVGKIVKSRTGTALQADTSATAMTRLERCMWCQGVGQHDTDQYVIRRLGFDAPERSAIYFKECSCSAEVSRREDG